MASSDDAATGPSRVRLIITAFIVALIVATVWAVIEYRQKPPPPPNEIGTEVR